MATVSDGLTHFWAHRKDTSLLLLPLGAETSSGQLLVKSSDMCHFWAKALNSETLHLPPPASSTVEVCVEMEVPQGESSL